jgi:Raf kinase inhibitor-like YbhB/YbcL family protein
MRPVRQASMSMMGVALALAVGVAACSSDAANIGGGTGGTTGGTGGTTGGSGGRTGDASTGDTAAGAITVTSSALSEGGNFLPQNTCAGANTSPPLSWTAGPAGTMSYAVALTDLSINAVHWVIYDIPVGTTSLPANLPDGATLTTPVMAKQIHRAAFFGAGSVYRGPCPSGNLHNYQFEVNAIPTAALTGIAPGGDGGPSTSDGVQAAAKAASLAHGDLTGMSNATAPPADASGQ